MLVHEGSAGRDEVRQGVERRGVVDEAHISDGKHRPEIIRHRSLKEETRGTQMLKV